MSDENKMEMYFHLIYTKLIDEIAELKAAITKNTGQLRELNHILRVKNKMSDEKHWDDRLTSHSHEKPESDYENWLNYPSYLKNNPDFEKKLFELINKYDIKLNEKPEGYPKSLWDEAVEAGNIKKPERHEQYLQGYESEVLNLLRKQGKTISVEFHNNLIKELLTEFLIWWNQLEYNNETMSYDCNTDFYYDVRGQLKKRLEE